MTTELSRREHALGQIMQLRLNSLRWLQVGSIALSAYLLLTIAEAMTFGPFWWATLTSAGYALAALMNCRNDLRIAVICKSFDVSFARPVQLSNRLQGVLWLLLVGSVGVAAMPLIGHSRPIDAPGLFGISLVVLMAGWLSLEVTLAWRKTLKEFRDQLANDG